MEEDRGNFLSRKKDGKEEAEAKQGAALFGKVCCRWRSRLSSHLGNHGEEEIADQEDIQVNIGRRRGESQKTLPRNKQHGIHWRKANVHLSSVGNKDFVKYCKIYEII